MYTVYLSNNPELLFGTLIQVKNSDGKTVATRSFLCMPHNEAVRIAQVTAADYHNAKVIDLWEE